MAVGDDVGDLDEGGRLFESGDEEHVRAGALCGELPGRLAAAGEDRGDVAGGRAGDGRRERHAELAGQGQRVLLLDLDALGGVVLAAAEAEDEGPRRQRVRVDRRAGSLEQPRQVGVVEDQDLVAEPDAVEAVGEVDQLVELGGRGEQVLVSGGDELAPDRRPGHHAEGALRAGQQAEEVGLARPLGVGLHEAALPLGLERQRSCTGLAGEHDVAVAPHDAAAAQRLGQVEVVARDQRRLALEQARDHGLVRARVQRRRDAHAVLGERGLELRVRDARLDDDHAVAPVDAQDLVHAAQVEHHGAGHARHGVAVEVRAAGADRHQRRRRLVGPGDDLLDLFRRAGPDDGPRRQARDEALVLRELLETRRVGRDVVAADERGEPFDDLVHLWNLPRSVSAVDCFRAGDTPPAVVHGLSNTDAGQSQRQLPVWPSHRGPTRVG